MKQLKAKIEKKIKLAEQRIEEEEREILSATLQYWVGYKDALDDLIIDMEEDDDTLEEIN